jgi:hypothetical protein
MLVHAVVRELFVQGEKAEQMILHAASRAVQARADAFQQSGLDERLQPIRGTLTKYAKG